MIIFFGKVNESRSGLSADFFQQRTSNFENVGFFWLIDNNIIVTE